MPRGDGTGPNGMGSMTGRGAGFCAGYDRPGYANPWGGRAWGYGRGFGRGMGRAFGGWGRGLGRGFGRGMGFRGAWGPAPMWGGYAPQWTPPAEPSPDAEAEMLRNQAEYLEQELAEIKQRLDELEQE